MPASIIRKDLIPKMQKDPNYLTDNKIRIYNQQGQEIQPEQVNWHTDEATNYMFRQDPGVDLNSMGFVRINSPTVRRLHARHAGQGHLRRRLPVRLVGLRARPECARLRRLAAEGHAGWNREHIEATIQSGQRIDGKLAQPVTVYWVYVTAWATPDGLVQFRDDIYSRDGLGSIPVASRAQPADRRGPAPEQD